MQAKPDSHSAQMRVAGQMSGTSADGIDLAVVLTDGTTAVPTSESIYTRYDSRTREDVLEAGREVARLPAARLRQREFWPEYLLRLERRLTAANAAAIRKLSARPDLVGFHGQTVHHRPEEGFTVQLGDGDRLAREIGVPVVWDFRRADMEAGGQGAPLVPFYHHAILRHKGVKHPCAVLNLGGVANVSFVDPRIDLPETKGALLAFDTGPGCALIDAWVEGRGEGKMDIDGALGRRGKAHRKAIRYALNHPYFLRPPPKSLDRDAFTLDAVSKLTLKNGAATLAALTAVAAVDATRWVSEKPRRWYLCGGGRRNLAIVDTLRIELGEVTAEPVESLGLDGDFLEAQAFAYLARRSWAKMPLTTSSTTGCSVPTTGGRLSHP